MKGKQVWQEMPSRKIDSKTSTTIDMHACLNFCYRHNALKRVLFRVSVVALAGIVLYLATLPREADSKRILLERLTQFSTLGGNDRVPKDLHSMYDAVTATLDNLIVLASDASARFPPNGSAIMIDEGLVIQQITISLMFLSDPCGKENVCSQDEPLDRSLWTSRYMLSVEGHAHLAYGLVLYTNTNSSLGDLKSKILKLQRFAHYYAANVWIADVYFLVHDVLDSSSKYIGFNRFSKGTSDGTTTSRINSMAGNNPLALVRYDTQRSYVRLLGEILLVVLIAYTLLNEIDQLLMCRKLLTSVYRYVSCWFNLLTWFTHVWTAVVIIARWYLTIFVAPGNVRAFAENPVLAPELLEKMMLDDSPTFENLVYYSQCVNLLVMTVLPFEYSYCNRATKIIWETFTAMWKVMRDLVVVLVYLMLSLASVLFLFAAGSGVNKDFDTVINSLDVATRITFNQYAYTDFLDRDGTKTGVANMKGLMVGIFWISVFVLAIFAQNIILAIVGEAYNFAKSASLEGSMYDTIAFYAQVLFFIRYRVEVFFLRLRGLSHDDIVRKFIKRSITNTASEQIRTSAIQTPERPYAPQKPCYYGISAKMALAEVRECGILYLYLCDPVEGDMRITASYWETRDGGFHGADAEVGRDQHECNLNQLVENYSKDRAAVLDLFDKVRKCTLLRGHRYAGLRKVFSFFEEGDPRESEFIDWVCKLYDPHGSASLTYGDSRWNFVVRKARSGLASSKRKLIKATVMNQMASALHDNRKILEEIRMEFQQLQSIIENMNKTPPRDSASSIA